MGSDDSHFNVSVGSDGQSHKTVSTNHNLSEEKGEPKSVSNRGPSAYQPNALPLGQTGSQRLTNQLLLLKGTVLTSENQNQNQNKQTNKEKAPS